MTDTTWLNEVLNEFRQSSIIIHAQGSVLGVDEDVRAFATSLEDAKATILTKLEEAVDSKMAEFMLKNGVKYDIAEEMGKMMEIQGVNGTWNYDPYMHGMYNGMEFCHALAKGVEPKYRKAPKQWLADIPMPKNAKPTQTYPKRSKE